MTQMSSNSPRLCLHTAILGRWCPLLNGSKSGPIPQSKVCPATFTPVGTWHHLGVPGIRKMYSPILGNVHLSIWKKISTRSNCG